MTVTVCIPAYRAGAFIAQTVGAALAQTHADLRVVVAIDPPDDGSPDDTAAALAPLAADPRLHIRHNPSRLGWAENVNSLLSTVTTPFFCFLPHDDIWAPQYLETMLAALAANPQAIIAYGDILRFGAGPPIRKSVILPPGANRLTALLHFLLQGADAQIWRGVTRTSALPRIGGFPTDRHKGLVVEAEYALALMGAGPVVHVPRTLYFKRIYEVGLVSASRERMLAPVDDRRLGLAEHVRRMRALLAAQLDDLQADDDMRLLCETASEAGLLRRFQQFIGIALGPDEMAQAQAALARLGERTDEEAGRIAANLHFVLYRHWRLRKDWPLAALAAASASASAATYDTALIMAETLLRDGQPLAALERATEALRLGHLDETTLAQMLIARIYAQLGWTPPGKTGP